MMADKCKKKASTLEVCDDMALAFQEQMLRRQVLRNFATGQRRERVVIQKGKKNMALQYCPFCRIDIAIPNKTPNTENSNA